MAVHQTTTAPALVNVPGGKPDLDETAKTAASHLEADGTIRLRVQPAFLIGGDYKGWEGVRWIIDFASLDQVVAYRQALEKFHRAFVAGKG